MKLAVSNIAWQDSEEEVIAELLQNLGVKYVEIAPTKRWEDPTLATQEEINNYIDFWGQYGIEIVAFQSMLFNRPDLTIFENSEKREQTLQYLSAFTELAGKFGAKRMVFGSPKNRNRGDMSPAEALEVATPFFSALGAVAQKNGVIFCIEPNAPQYTCDFITNSTEGIELVTKIDSSGIGLHLDAACMALAGEDLGESIRHAADRIEHYHISSPMLAQVEPRSDVDHKNAVAALKEIAYDKIVSIEMRPDIEGENLHRVKEAVEFAQQVYSS